MLRDALGFRQGLRGLERNTALLEVLVVFHGPSVRLGFPIVVPGIRDAGLVHFERRLPRRMTPSSIEWMSG